MFCLCDVVHLWSLFSKMDGTSKKEAILAIQGVQQIGIALCSCKIMRYMDMIKMLGLLKSFAFVILTKLIVKTPT